jgi:nicotinate-nucleotide--dimethylbenzimidazole phosphoribosyltransferase
MSSNNYPDGLDDLRRLLAEMPPGDEAAVAAVRRRDAELTKPAGSLGRLEDLVEWLARWQGRAPPTVDHPLVAVFAANHGVVGRGVSAFPAAVTAQMVANFQAGGAAINRICSANRLALRVHPLMLDRPTADFTEAPAMTEEELVAALSAGMGAVEDGIDLICLGEMGIGNTTAAAAIALALFGGTAVDWGGRGTGIDDAGLARKRAVVSEATARHQAIVGDPFAVLRCLGGREIAAMAGAILGARLRRVPVVVDGYVAGAAAAIVAAAAPGAIDHCAFGHVSAEPGHRRMLDRLGRTPLLDLGMRLGEGTGAALAAVLIRTAAAVHAGMATFAEAGVAGRDSGQTG